MTAQREARITFPIAQRKIFRAAAALCIESVSTLKLNMGRRINYVSLKDDVQMAVVYLRQYLEDKEKYINGVDLHVTQPQSVLIILHGMKLDVMEMKKSIEGLEKLYEIL